MHFTKKEGFVGELVARYLQAHPVDEEGKTHVRMVRLEAAFGKVG